MNTSEEKNTSGKKLQDYPSGNLKIQNKVFMSLFIIGITSFLGLIFTEIISKKEMYSFGVGITGLVIFFTGIVLSIIYTKRYNKPQGGFGLFLWIGGFISIWGILIHFMQKV